MQELTDRINRALAKEEARAERFANAVRLILLALLTAIAIANVSAVSLEANTMNFGVLIAGYAYGLVVLVRVRRGQYHPAMKYVTSCLDVGLVFLLLFLYARIEVPSVALKNYVFLVLFPLIALTAFRYDRTLTLVAGGLALALYVGLVLYLVLARALPLSSGGYEQELFSGEVTYIGQLTKLLMLGGYVILLAYLAGYSRRLFAELIASELNIRSEKEKLDWEMKIASQVQTQFLPRSVPAMHGLELAGTLHQGKLIGGDYYDFIPLSDGRLFLAVADVSGNGVPAALIMAEVRAATHLLITMRTRLREIVEQLNTLVYQSTDKKHFVTFFAAEIDAANGTFSYVSAGHPPPLLCSNGHVRALAKGTLALGLQNSLPGLLVRSEKFLSGDTLVCYTDGITEQTNAYGDQYGEERLRAEVQADAPLDAQQLTVRLFEAVRTFAGGKELDDDVTIAVVRRS